MMKRWKDHGAKEVFEAKVPLARGPLCTVRGNGFFLAGSSHWYVMFPWTKLWRDTKTGEWVLYEKFRVCLGKFRFHLFFNDVGITVQGSFFHPPHGSEWPAGKARWE